MGLLTTQNDIKYQLEELKKQKQLDSIENYKLQKERKKEAEQKRELKLYKTRLEDYVYLEFKKYFDIAGNEYITEFYNEERKKEILQDFFKTIKTNDNLYIDNFKIPFKEDLTRHFNNKYFTILKKAHSERKKQELYNLTQMPVEETEEAKSIQVPDIGKIILLLITLILLFTCFPAFVILSLLFAVIKASQ